VADAENQNFINDCQEGTTSQCFERVESAIPLNMHGGF